jgi:hypothetical protein
MHLHSMNRCPIEHMHRLSLMNRAYQLLLIATFVPLCWLTMQAVHELGHATAACATGGTVAKVVLHPLTISRTDTVGSGHPLAVVWAGPVVGVGLPLAILALFRIARWKWDNLAQFFAGTCLIANGAYLGVGSFQGIGDAGDLIRLGSPNWCLWLFGLIAVASGLFYWNGLGPSFGLGRAAGVVDRRAAVCSAVLLVIVVIIEVVFNSSQ